MVRRGKYLLWLSLLIGLSANSTAATFNVLLVKSQVELGKYVYLMLSSDQTSPSLHSVDLRSLQGNFFVDSTADIVTRQQGQHWKLRLYPRQTGHLRVAPLTFAGIRSHYQSLDVDPAIDSVTGQQLTIETSISERTAWLRQQVLLKLSVLSRDQHVVLETSSPPLPTGELHRFETVTQATKTVDLRRHTIGWAYFPTRIGKQTLQLPPIYYKRDGVITHRFYFPIQHLQVMPLPLYVPANFVVGRLSLQVMPYTHFLLNHRLHTINIRLHAAGVLQQGLPQLENYLHSTSALHLYPVSTNLQQTSTNTGLNSQVDIQLPIRSDSNGLSRLDDIELQYFEPGSGKLQTLRYHWSPIFFISPWLLVLGGLLILPPLVYGIMKLLFIINGYWRRYRDWHLARQQLLAATTPQEVRVAVLQMCRAEFGIGNKTLKQYSVYTGIDCEPLNRALYGRSGIDIQFLKQVYLQLRLKKLKFII